MTPAIASNQPAAALRSLRRARRRNRRGNRDLGSRLYDAYVTILAAGGGVWLLTVLARESVVMPSQAAWVVANGPGLTGVAVALAILLGLRSGAGGGPLALEMAVVQHELLAPIERRAALRGPALRYIGRWSSVGAVIGATAGAVAAQVFRVSAATVVASSAAAGLLAGSTIAAAALLASGARTSARLANLLGGALVAASAADWLAGTKLAPTTCFGELALGPARGKPVAFVVVVAATAVLLAAALWAVGGTSIEAARRRAGLVERLRFAAALQDLRMIVRLRRQLAAEAARARPWVRLAIANKGGPGRRAIRGLLRFPAVRVVRMVVLGAVAGAALALYEQASLLLPVAALALFAAGCDAVEALAQETDRPARWRTYPLASPRILLPLVAVAVLAMLPAAAAALVTATACGLPPARVILVAWTVALGAAGAVIGAAISTLLGPFDPVKMAMQSAVQPELYGVIWLDRLVLPPALTLATLLPIITRSAPVGWGVVSSPLSLVALTVIASGLAWIARRRPEAG